VSVNVFVTVKAAQPHWLVRLLEPVIEACRFESAPPVELRPTGGWSGWCQNRTDTPDGRVCVSRLLEFRPPGWIVDVYLHEASHRVLEPYNVAAHGSEFAALLEVLYLRSILATNAPRWRPTGVGPFLSIYDFQDAPDLALSVEFIIYFSDKYYDSQLSVEALAKIVSGELSVFVEAKQKSLAITDGLESQLNRTSQLVDCLKSKNLTLKLWSVVGWSIVVMQVLGSLYLISR
jgi:hypothetical protein